VTDVATETPTAVMVATVDAYAVELRKRARGEYRIEFLAAAAKAEKLAVSLRALLDA
jgi:hypothetical protein